MKDAITTFGGRMFTPLSPRSEDICVEDIAHALSLMTRANGHYPEFYSVAQHSLDCAMLAKAEGRSAREVRACLLHDASEAYLSDITRPVKANLPEYHRIEHVLQEAIYNKYIPGGLTKEEQQTVKRIDDTCLYYEFDHFMGRKLFDTPPEIVRLPAFKLRPMKDVETEFLAVYESCGCI